LREQLNPSEFSTPNEPAPASRAGARLDSSASLGMAGEGQVVPATPVAPGSNADLPGTPVTTASPRETVRVPAGNADDVPGALASSIGASFESAIQECQALMEAGEWSQALKSLSRFYRRPDLSSEQNQQLFDLLDPLAAKVLYSTEHLMELPHEISRGDTLDGIAQACQVPAELLANINGIDQADLLVPGTRLKVVRGPFRAEISLATSELTIFAGPLYAGRFPISVGKDPPPLPGTYKVQERQKGRVYYAGDGRTIPIDDPTNPYGQVWIGLGNEMCIHGSSQSGDIPGLGCISLSPRDALDVYSILSAGSEILIHK
jgi:hypothetical protein